VSLEVLTTLKIMNNGIKCWELVPRRGVITDQHAFNEQKNINTRSLQMDTWQT
jgi:hypothetical protein